MGFIDEFVDWFRCEEKIAIEAEKVCDEAGTYDSEWKILFIAGKKF